MTPEEITSLAREFREEVKKEWELTDNSESPHDAFLRGKYQMMRDLLGHHNLTSDTEEEEMLTVSRKEVRSIYDLAKEIAVRVANKYNDPEEVADYAVKVAKAVAERLKRK